MSRTYELVFIADPRLTDEEVVGLAEEYKGMITAGGGEITKEESWGRRKLAYPILKFNEGRYHILYITADGSHNLAEVEQRMEQNDKVLRHLVVRTDLDLKRAARKGKKKPATSSQPAPSSQPARGGGRSASSSASA